MLTKRIPIDVSQIVFLLLCVLAALMLAYSGGPVRADSISEKWVSPAPSAAKKNPIQSTQDSVGAGQKIYSKTCAMCHGKTGDADGPAVIELNIHPAKLSDPQLARESDGSLFWKITTGKKPMPAYGKRLSETDRWNLVNYVRTLSTR
ncbi:MAG TPA: c-type cytochrome [Candidatus Udaeobacter sp.]